MKTVVGMFDSYANAQKAAQDLENTGIPQNDISLVASNENQQFGSNPSTDSSSTTGGTGHAIVTDAEVGAGIGGVLGLMAGASLFVIPGLGWLAGAGWFAGLIGGAAVGGVAGGIVGALTHVGVPHEDAVYYNEGIRRGGTLMTVRADDNIAPRVAQILGENGAIDIDSRAAQWRQEGFLPTPATTTSTTATPPQINAVPAPAPFAATTQSDLDRASTSPPGVATNQTGVNRQGETVLPVIEEELAVGKRQIQEGGVRVYRHVIETPVEEQVTLHEEHINVERRPVDRAVSPDEINRLQDENIEVVETREVPVVSKEARIVEEVVVGKQATDRTETVSDTVRRTEVEVEQLGGQTTNTIPASEHTARNLAANATNTVERREGSLPGIQTGGHAIDAANAPDTRGLTEKSADTVTANRVDDKTGRPV